MRKVLAGVCLLIAVAALTGLIASLLGADLGEGGRPMLFARALVLSVGGLVITLRWRRRGLNRPGRPGQR